MDFGGAVWASGCVQALGRHSQDRAAARMLTLHWLQQRCRVATPLAETSISVSSTKRQHQFGTQSIFFSPIAKKLNTVPCKDGKYCRVRSRARSLASAHKGGDVGSGRELWQSAGECLQDELMGPAIPIFVLHLLLFLPMTHDWR